MHFLEAAWKEWKTACYEEMESLDKGDVFELTDLPKGHKTIGCRWVFDVKGDSRKKARLVTPEFLASRRSRLQQTLLTSCMV